MVGHPWQTGEDVAKVGVRINAAATAGFDDGVDDRSALTGSGFADEQPVFLANGGWSNGIFHEVIIDLHSAVFQEHAQCWPLAQRVIHGLAEQTLRQVAMAGAKADQGAFESLHNRPAVTGSKGGAQVRSSPLVSQRRFDLVELLDLAQQPGRRAGRLLQRVVDFAADVSPTTCQLDGSLAAVGKGAIGRVAVALDHAAKVGWD